MLDPRFVVTQDLDSYFVDKDTGLPLAGGILTFYEDEARTVLKDVYTLTGAPPYSESSYVPLPNPVILSSVGTVQDAGGNNVPIYYFPFDGDQFTSLGVQELYYITVTDSAGTLQFTREAWPNPQESIAPQPPSTSGNFTENQISNPTFTNVFLNPGIPNTLLVSMTNQIFPIAPDWTIVASGSGMIVIRQVPISGNDNVPSSPPYVLDISVGPGITQCFLRQRFLPNSGLWASTAGQPIFLSGSYVAQNENGGTVSVPMYYAPSGIASPILIFTGMVTPIFQFLSGGNASPIPISTDSNSGNLGYVDIYLSLSADTHIQVSSIQLIPSLAAFVNPLDPDLNSSDRNEAYQGDYYIPRLNAKTIRSFLIGWDFPLNPFQFSATGGVTTTPAYIVDQTIAQTSNSTASWVPDPATDGLQFSGAGANSSFYLLQYLQGSDVQKMIGTNLSVNVFGYGFNNLNPVTMRVYLFRSIGAGTIPALTSGTIGNIASDGTFTLDGTRGANWEAIPRMGLPIPAMATLNTVATSVDINNGTNDYGFTGWQITDGIETPSTNDNFAMVVTFAYTNAPTGFTINSISLAPGDIPCRPTVQSPDEVLRQCQYYYEKSYATNVYASTSGPASTFVNSILCSQPITPLDQTGSTVTRSVIGGNFQFSFNSVKIVPPMIKFYSPNTGTLGVVNSVLVNQGLAQNQADNAITGWTASPFTYIGTKGANYTSFGLQTLVSFSTTSNGLQGFIRFHYVADSRLGIT